MIQTLVLKKVKKKQNRNLKDHLSRKSKDISKGEEKIQDSEKQEDEESEKKSNLRLLKIS